LPWWAYIAPLLLVAGILKVACGPDAHDKARARAEATMPAAPAPPPETAIPMKSEALHREYEANEAAADDKYKGRLLLVEGVIRSISKDAFDNTYLILAAGSAFDGVHATLTDAEAPKAKTLKKRQRVEVECRGGGRVLTSAMLEKCAITATWQ